MPKSKKDIEQFKNGIFSLRTNFGELAQLMIKKKYGLKKSTKIEYDLIAYDDEKNEIPVEVKFARAYKNSTSINEKNILDICLHRSVDVFSSDDADLNDMFCNIEQIKPDLFNRLYYGVFWNDKVEIFCIDESKHHLFPDSIEHFKTDKKYSKDIRKEIPYLYLQHNKKDYQFYLKKNSVPVHRKSFFKDSLTYEDLFNLFAEK